MEREGGSKESRGPLRYFISPAPTSPSPSWLPFSLSCLWGMVWLVCTGHGCTRAGWQNGLLQSGQESCPTERKKLKAVNKCIALARQSMRWKPEKEVSLFPSIIAAEHWAFWKGVEGGRKKEKPRNISSVSSLSTAPSPSASIADDVRSGLHQAVCPLSTPSRHLTAGLGRRQSWAHLPRGAAFSFLIVQRTARPQFPRTLPHATHLFTLLPPRLPPAKIIITMADLSGWASSIFWGGGWVGKADKWRCSESAPWRLHGNWLSQALAARLCTNSLSINMQVASSGEVCAAAAHPLGQPGTLSRRGGCWCILKGYRVLWRAFCTAALL